MFLEVEFDVRPCFLDYPEDLKRWLLAPTDSLLLRSFVVGVNGGTFNASAVTCGALLSGHRVRFRGGGFCLPLGRNSLPQRQRCCRMAF